jgi:hypothetical protein
VGSLEVRGGPDAGQQQCREPGVGESPGRRRDPLVVGVTPEPVVERRAPQAVAMRHLDGVDTGGVEGEADRLEIVNGILVADGVHAIAQRHVLEVEPLGGPEVGSVGHTATPCRVCASRSPARSAAEVMMSRLPA